MTDCPEARGTKLRRAALWVAAAALVALVAGLATGNADLSKQSALVVAVGAAVGLGAVPALSGFQYTAWIAVAFLTGMLFPGQFQQFKDYKWFGLLVVQAVMFGMGTQMRTRDFAGVLRMPWGVVVGLVCQFTIMPLVGFGLAKALGFPPEIGAGIVLIGACSSGLASNVMAFLARANLALSITLTSVATLLAPLMTPLWMSLLAGEMVEVKFVSMMATVVKIVIVPVGAALLHDFLGGASPRARILIYGAAVAALAWCLFLLLGGWAALSGALEGQTLELGVVLPGYVLATFLVGVVYHHLVRHFPGLGRAMPVMSMAGIIYFTTVATAAGQASLMQVGFLLFAAAVVHNGAGYVLGYWLSRLCGLGRNDARTVAFEVGLQNGGMASGLALSMGKLGTVGLASAVFSPWMNVSGSVLANWWRRRPADREPRRESQA